MYKNVHKYMYFEKYVNPSKSGTHKTVKARFWPVLAGKCPQTL